MNGLIIESIRIAVSAARRDQLRRELAAWFWPAGVESGCISCKILQEDSDPLAFCYQALWKTRDDLLRHLRADDYKRLLARVGNKRPAIDQTGTERGLSFIQKKPAGIGSI